MSATPLFRDRTVRSVTSAALAAFAAHFLTGMIPHTMHTYNLLQSSVAMLALASLSILNGQFLSQTQEEVILIAAFGFFWLGTIPGIAWSKSIRGIEDEPSVLPAIEGHVVFMVF
ncbi:hypothetical protein EVJ58_g9079 [Rhodofomes roseus]|uniref:Uncharacterized protein n=1 Tax=Rhodofomes roseus TaxID=34475 RepID=A0A4Y9XZM6_9APHY|nr:hypothetical protein EVJ58_g9079 [Rhodofomes roseus]